MYTFDDQGRPLAHAAPRGHRVGAARRAGGQPAQAGNLPVKLWYSGSYYRYERPQTGRYRHFSQVGAEAIGAEDPALDAELIILADEAYRSLGLRELPAAAELAGRQGVPPGLPRARCRTSCAASTSTRTPAAGSSINPLRVLDDKRADVQTQLAGAPLLRDYLCEACKAYHEEVRDAADRRGRGLRGRRRSWCAASTTTPAPPSSSSTTGSARSPRSAAAAATTACPR